MLRHLPHRLPNRPLRVLVALTALLAAVTAVLAPAAAALPGAPAFAATSAPAAQQQTFGIQPSSASGPDQRPAFTYAATPGAQVKDHVAVYNYGDEPLTLTLYAADAFNTAGGGYDVLPAAKRSSDIGAWVHLAVGSVVLPPRTRQIVPFTLAIPAQASPGDHAGGIVLALRRQTVDAKGNAVAVDQRVGTRIHLRIPGALRPHLAVESVSVHYRGTLNPFGTGSTTISYTVRNTGNIRLGGHQAVRVRNVLGMVATASGPSDLTELLPGNTATYSVQVPGVLPTLWSTASITVDPLAVPGDSDPALASAVSDNDYPTVPWTLIALLIPVVGLAVRALLRRRRRSQDGGAPSFPSDPTTPSGPSGLSGPGGTPVTPQAPTAPSTLTAPEAPEAPADGIVAPVPVPVPVPVPGSSPATAPVPEVPSPRVPAPTGATGPAGEADSAVDSAGSASGATASRQAGRVRSLLRDLGVGAVLVTALLGGSNAAFASDASPSASVSGSATAGAADSGPGVVYFDYAKGRDDDPINLATSGRCPGEEAWVGASVSGPGFPAAGASALGLSAAKIYNPSSTGGYVIPLDQTLRAIARQNGVSTLRGAYRVDVYCRGRFNPAHLRDFYGTLTFGAAEAWTADRSTPVAMPQSSEPPATAIPTAHQVAAPAPATGGGISPVSIVTVVAGGLLLLGLGVSTLRRRRAEVLAAKSGDRSPDKKPATARKPAIGAKAATRAKGGATAEVVRAEAARAEESAKATADASDETKAVRR